jgi:predicted nucleotidyltransferase
MRVRLRDFVETEEGLFFAVNTYYHPEDRVLCFLRYVNLDSIKDNLNLNINDVRILNGRKYIKMAETEKAYKFLETYFPEYLFYDEVNDVLMHSVPNERIRRILRPNERLRELLNSDNPNELEERCIKLADILHDYGIPYKHMGVSGSMVLKLNNSNSDIDFVIYGMKNHKKAREALKNAFEDKKLSPLSNEFWKKSYEKRIKDGTLTFEEFVWHEKRKFNRGVVDGVMFDLLATREWDEITERYGEKRYKNLGFVEIEGVVVDATYAFDNPAVYRIKCSDEEIKEVVSFTHTYAGQCFEGEEVVVRGKLEEVISNGESYKRVVVGTSREAFNEYIKLKK